MLHPPFFLNKEVKMMQTTAVKTEAKEKKKLVCPIRHAAVMISGYPDLDQIYCIGEECAWYLICRNISWWSYK